MRLWQTRSMRHLVAAHRALGRQPDTTLRIWLGQIHAPGNLTMHSKQQSRVASVFIRRLEPDIQTYAQMQKTTCKPKNIYLKKTDVCLKNRRGCHKMTRFRTLPTNHEPKLHQCLASCKMCKLLNYRARISHLGSVPDSEHRGEGSFNKLLHKQWSKQCFLFARTRQYDAIEASLRFADIGNAVSLNQDPKMKSDWTKKHSKMFQNDFVHVIADWKWFQKYLPELHASLVCLMKMALLHTEIVATTIHFDHPSSVKVLVPIENKVSSPFWRLAWENVKPQFLSKLHSLDWSICKVPPIPNAHFLQAAGALEQQVVWSTKRNTIFSYINKIWPQSAPSNRKERFETTKMAQILQRPLPRTRHFLRQGW